MQTNAGKRILMLLENNNYSHDTRVRREARTLAEAGYQVTVIAPRQKNAKRPPETGHPGIKVYEFPTPPGGSGVLSYIGEYAFAVSCMFLLSLIVWRREGFDVIHAHNPPDILFAIAAFYKPFGKKFIFDHHDVAPEMFAIRFGTERAPWVYKLMLWAERLSCRMADHIIATNDSHKEIAVTRGGASPVRVTVARNGPAEHRYPVPPDPELRSRAGTILGYVGIMAPQDGLDYLLRALHHLVYTLERSDVLCVLIGKGDSIPELKKLTSQLGLDNHVWFTGWVSDEDLLKYLCSTDICLVPDPSNAFNDRCTMIKIMEYMLLSKPIVAFDLPEHRVTAGGAAVYAANNDELEYARQIGFLIDNPDQRIVMGRIGRERIDTRLDWSHQKEHLLAAYAKVTSVPTAIAHEQELLTD